MRLLKIENISEHLLCSNYERGRKPLIERIKVLKGDTWECSVLENTIILVVDGELSVSFYKYRGNVVSAGKFFLIPTGQKVNYLAQTDCFFIVVRLSDKHKLCECYPIEHLHNDSSGVGGAEVRPERDSTELYTLDMNSAVLTFVRGMDEHIDNGLKCRFFFEIKSKELFYLLRGYYSKDELRHLFQPMLTSDTSFSEEVRNNAMKYKTATELAAAMNYTLSGFNKRFKTVFGVPAYQWMLEQKKDVIYNELRSGDKNIKTLCSELGFCSPSNFSSFCKRYFGQAPGEIRKNREE